MQMLAAVQCRFVYRRLPWRASMLLSHKQSRGYSGFDAGSAKHVRSAAVDAMNRSVESVHYHAGIRRAASSIPPYLVSVTWLDRRFHSQIYSLEYAARVHRVADDGVVGSL